jgi:hypothetical protein
MLPAGEVDVLEEQIIGVREVDRLVGARRGLGLALALATAGQDDQYCCDVCGAANG